MKKLAKKAKKLEMNIDILLGAGAGVCVCVYLYLSSLKSKIKYNCAIANNSGHARSLRVYVGWQGAGRRGCGLH